MRLQQRNLKSIWYCLYAGKQAVTDDDGYETGEYEVTYQTPVQIKCNVSPAMGQSQLGMFGNLESYDKVIVIDDMSCPIDENTVLFIDRVPTRKDGVYVFNYDYVVRRVAKSLNSIAIAVSKVKVDSIPDPVIPDTPMEPTEPTEPETGGEDDPNAEEDDS